MASFEFTGKPAVTELARDLDGAAAGLAGKASKLVTTTARKIRDDARGLAPVDTGALRQSIIYRSHGPFAASIGPTARHGLFVERGTSKMAPQPFLGPATDRNEAGFTAAAAVLGSEALEGG